MQNEMEPALKPYALFRDDRTSRSMLFSNPREIVVARTAAEILPALQRLEQARKDGFWLAGYISYEAGHIFEEKLRHLIVDDRETPLVCMGVFEAPKHESDVPCHPSATMRRSSTTHRLPGASPIIKSVSTPCISICDVVTAIRRT